MKKLFLPLIFFIASSQVYADWQHFAGDANNKFYVDKSSIKVANGFVRIWTLDDYASASKGALSAKNYLEIDCKGEKYRFLSIKTFAMNMGIGKILQFSNSEYVWMDVVPNPSINLLLQKVCH